MDGTSVGDVSVRDVMAANGSLRVHASGFEQQHANTQLRDPQHASATAVAALPTFTWRVPHARPKMVSEKMATCAICTEDLEDGCRVTSMPCGHLFHAPCLRPWLQQQHTCPV